MALRKLLILRKLRSSCLEGRTAPIQQIFNSFTRSFAGVTRVARAFSAKTSNTFARRGTESESGERAVQREATSPRVGAQEKSVNEPLDNPIWHALVGPHAGFAFGRGAARHYPRDIAPFSGIAEPMAAAYRDLAADLPPGFEARLFRPTDEAVPPMWETVSSRPIVQMVADRTIPEPAPIGGVVSLGEADADEMLALAAAARPGPFDRRTVLLGNYVGVRREARLVAMAGERFRLPGYVELSAICVHPDWRGMGFGSGLTQYLAHRASADGEVPFLHVFPENPAILLYARLGFRERTRLWVLWRRPKIGSSV